MRVVPRRVFLASGLVAAVRAATPTIQDRRVYRFVRPECTIRMAVEFHDGYSSRGFWFHERSRDRQFCLSAVGEEGHECLASFNGSLAIAEYTIEPRTRAAAVNALRESVRTIDRDSRLDYRPQFERTIELRQGVASDLQAFGYEAPPPAPAIVNHQPEAEEPWYYFRQDLYLGRQGSPFLVIHWKHAFSAIRLLDVIPGDGTSPVRK